MLLSFAFDFNLRRYTLEIGSCIGKTDNTIGFFHTDCASSTYTKARRCSLKQVEARVELNAPAFSA
jgi:hypothetical protein